MSAPTDEVSHEMGSEETHPAARPDLRAQLLEAGVIVGWFVVAGVLGALIWWQVTDLPSVTRDGNDAVQLPDELAKQVAIDAWFAVIALIGGTVSGAALVSWRRRDPLLTVALVTIAAGLASWLMLRLGLLLGPGEVTEALRDVADGGSVPMQLKLHAPGVAWLWPATAAFGAMVVLWVGPNPDAEHD